MRNKFLHEGFGCIGLGKEFGGKSLFCYSYGLFSVKSFWNTSYHRGTLYCRGYNGEKAELLLIYKQHKQLQSLQKSGPLAVEGEAGVRPGAEVRCVTLYHWDTSNVRLA